MIIYVRTKVNGLVRKKNECWSGLAASCGVRGYQSYERLRKGRCKKYSATYNLGWWPKLLAIRAIFCVYEYMDRLI